MCCWLGIRWSFISLHFRFNAKYSSQKGNINLNDYSTSYWQLPPWPFTRPFPTESQFSFLTEHSCLHMLWEEVGWDPSLQPHEASILASWLVWARSMWPSSGPWDRSGAVSRERFSSLRKKGCKAVLPPVGGAQKKLVQAPVATPRMVEEKSSWDLCPGWQDWGTHFGDFLREDNEAWLSGGFPLLADRLTLPPPVSV